MSELPTVLQNAVREIRRQQTLSRDPTLPKREREEASVEMYNQWQYIERLLGLYP